MTVASKRFGQTNAAGGAGGAQTTIYTVPTDRTAIVKELRASCSAAAAFPATVAWEVSFSGGTFRRVWAQTFGAANAVDRHEAWFVLAESDVLRINVPAGMTVFAMASGALLEGDSRT